MSGSLFLNIGNINDAFIVSFNVDPKIKKYIKQRINHNVSINLKKLMDNMKKITLHIAENVKLALGEVSRESLNLVKTKSGKLIIKVQLVIIGEAFYLLKGLELI